MNNMMIFKKFQLHHKCLTLVKKKNKKIDIYIYKTYIIVYNYIFFKKSNIKYN